MAQCQLRATPLSQSRLTKPPPAQGHQAQNGTAQYCCKRAFIAGLGPGTEAHALIYWPQGQLLSASWSSLLI